MPIALASTVTVGSSGAMAVEFSNIAQTGKDLLIVVSARNNPTGAVTDFFNLSFNGSTSGFTTRGVYGAGSFAGSFTSPSNFGSESVGSVATANTFSNSQIYISNYSSSVGKSYSTDGVGENNGTTANQTFSAGSWSGTAPITSLTLTPQNGLFVQYTTISLYIVDASTATATGSVIAPKATGGTITLSGGIFYHTFTSTGNSTFTPTENLSVDFAIVAGGGGGGGGDTNNVGGGGGAGGVITTKTGLGLTAVSKPNLTANTNYTITVGAGGNGGENNLGIASGLAGGFSAAFGSTATGGGYGSYYAQNGGSGGSGGGGGGGFSGAGSGGSGTSGQGGNGGAGYYNARSGGGGGGALGNGTSGTSTVAGSGGNGVDLGLPVAGAVAGGGAGGRGSGVSSGSNGTGQSGYGGGGAGGGSGQRGYDGVVIVWYPA